MLARFILIVCLMVSAGAARAMKDGELTEMSSWIISRHSEDVRRFDLPETGAPDFAVDLAKAGRQPLMIKRFTTMDDKQTRVVWMTVAVMEEGESMRTLLHEKLGSNGKAGGGFQTVQVEFIPVSTAAYPDITLLQHEMPLAGAKQYLPGAPDLLRWSYDSKVATYIAVPAAQIP